MEDTTQPVKIILIGPPSAGKTSLFNLLAGRKVDGSYKSTIGSDYTVIQVNIPTTDADPRSESGYRSVSVRLWDTAGQDRFQTLISSYYRDVNCCVVLFALYSVQNFKESAEFKKILDQIYEALMAPGGPRPLLIIGNKSDLKTTNGVENPMAKYYSGLSAKYFSDRLEEQYPDTYFFTDQKDKLAARSGEALGPNLIQSIEYQEFSVKEATPDHWSPLLQKMVTLAYTDKADKTKPDDLENTIRVHSLSNSGSGSSYCC